MTESYLLLQFWQWYFFEHNLQTAEAFFFLETNVRFKLSIKVAKKTWVFRITSQAKASMMDNGGCPNILRVWSFVRSDAANYRLANLRWTTVLSTFLHGCQYLLEASIFVHVRIEQVPWFYRDGTVQHRGSQSPKQFGWLSQGSCHL